MKDYLTFGRSLRILCFTSILLSLGLMYLRLNDFLLGLELVVPRLELFTGKLHPALVHFPLALLLSAILIEGYITVRDGFRGRNKRPHLVAGFCICFGALGAFVAAVSGWMNAANQEFFGSLVSVLFWHRWLGVFVAALSIFGALLYFASARLSLDSFSQRNALRFYLLSLFLVTPLLGVGAHFGGVMVHGEDYFAEVFELPNNESSLRASANLNDSSSAHVVSPVEIESLPLPVGRKVDFSKDVFPILKRSCFKCHGGGREKGKYRIDDRDSFISSGKHGPSVVPGDSGQSNVVHLIAGLIPDNVMPEKGRRLTDNEVSILRAWIDQGLPWGDGSDANFSARTTLKLAQVTIPEKTKELKNPIDRLLTPYFKKHKVTFPNTVTDRVFARRVYLDVVGLIPTPQQLDAFLASNSPSKREELVDDLLKQDAAYADYWLAYWNDLLRNDYSGPGFLNNNRKQITSWLRRALIKNTPYDRMVTSLVAPNSRSDGFLKGIVWSGDIGITEQPAIQAAQNIGQVFLGVNLKCATCHDSFTDEWTMEDTYGIANVYAKEPLEIHECEVPTGKIVQPGFLFPSLGKIDPHAKLDQRAKQLASLLVSPDNGRFSRTLINRIWKKLLGRGFIEPVDEMSEKPWHPELLDWLAKDFVEHQFDIRHLLKRIVTSQAYQMDSIPQDGGSGNYVFQGPSVRRMTAEQFVDAFHQVTGAWGEMTRADLMRMAKYSGGKEIHRSHTKGISILSDPKQVEVNLKGAKSILLVVNVRDPGEKRGKKLFQEWAVWGDPELVTSSGRRLRLSELKPVQALSSDTTFGEPSFRAFQGTSSDKVKIQGQVLQHALTVKPFSILWYDLPEAANGERFERFFSRVGVESDQKQKMEPGGKVPKLEFVVLSDVMVRASHFSENPLLNALGRPKRDQVTTSRDGKMTTLQALTLTNSSEVTKLIRDGAWSLIQKGASDPEDVVTNVFSSALGRAPTEEELKIGESYFEKGVSQQSLEDFIWAVVMLPEFQLIV